MTTDTDARDAELAEKLFGWTDIESHISWMTGRRPDATHREMIEPYSTTGDGEHRVRDALLVRGYQVKVHVEPDGTGGVTLWRDHKRTHVPVTQATTPQAMTEAALAAIEAEGR